MKKQALNILAVFAVFAAILILADVGSAQNRREARGKRFTKAQVENVIDRIEQRVDNFVRSYDKSLDNSRLDDTRREDWLLQRAENLENATDELRREFDRRDNWIENKAEVRKCLNIASDIDRNIKNRRYGRNTENIWARVRFELNTIADIYNLPKVGSRAY
jgi:sugar-specific transcriptional regulator TrmB